ncbi:MAG TPA: 50S ribosomal protein L25 [Rectinemataceae bacterium]|nr:50S ribosomal protein L25 [Rectinemataceae bacterium]
MEHRLLNAQVRNETTKGELRTFRTSGKIPAVLYGGGKDATKLFLDSTEFRKVSHGISESTILNLAIDGVTREVFVKEHQRNTLSGEIMHVDFLEIVKGRKLHAKVPLHLVGTPIGVRNGGILENPAHEVEVECDPRYLPEGIEVNVADLDANHSIHVRDLPAIDNVRVLSSPDLVVALVKFAKAEAEPVVEAAAPAAAGAAPAAGAAGAAPAAAPAAAAEKK